MNYPLGKPTSVVEKGNKAVVLSAIGDLYCEIHPCSIGIAAKGIDQVGEGLFHKIACFFIQSINI